MLTKHEKISAAIRISTAYDLAGSLAFISGVRKAASPVTRFFGGYLAGSLGDAIADKSMSASMQRHANAARDKLITSAVTSIFSHAQ